MSSDVSTAPRTKTPRALKAAVILSALFLLSRFTGLIQGQIIIALLPREATDAYNAAFTLPEYLNTLMASGALSLTFIPIFSGFWEKEREAQAWQFFSTLLCVMGAALTAMTLVFWLLAEPITLLINPGFRAPEKAQTLQMTVEMTRILLPAQIFFYLGGLMVGALNSFKRFGTTGWTGAIYNVVAMLVAIPAFKITGNPLVFAWGILLGALVGNFALPLCALLRGPKEQRPHFSPSFNVQLEGVRRYFLLSLPIMFSFSIATADVWVVKGFASTLETGALTHLNAAYRLMIAAVGVLGQAAAVAAFPFLASKAIAGDFGGLAQFLRTGLRRLLFISLSLSLFLILGAKPICTLVYGYGKGNKPDQLAEIAACFALFTLGLFAWATQGLVARGFYALGDTKTPNWTGTALCLGFFVPLCWIGRTAYGAPGLALATTIAIALYLVILLVMLENKLKREHRVAISLPKIGGTMLRTLSACTVAGIAGFLALKLGAPVMAHDKIGDIGLLIWVWGITGFVFVSSANRFAIPEWFWLREKVNRRRK